MPMKKAVLLLALFASTFVAACSGNVERKDEYETDPSRRGRYEYGSVASERGGLSLMGGGRDEAKARAGQSGIGVNAYLWRAALDTLSFLPTASADPFGGTIITDWYAPPSSPNERIKVNVYILGRELRSDGVRVTVFRQQNTQNGWVDVQTSPATAGTIEDSILTRARQLRVKQLQENRG